MSVGFEKLSQSAWAFMFGDDPPPIKPVLYKRGPGGGVGVYRSRATVDFRVGVGSPSVKFSKVCGGYI